MVERTRGAHLAPILRPSRFAALWWCSVVAAAVVAVGAARSLDLRSVLDLGPAYGVLLAMVILAEVRPVIASSHQNPNGVNLATAFLFAVLLRWGFDLAVLTMLLASGIGEAARRKRVFAATFNAAQYTLSYAAAAGMLALIGWTATPTAPASLQPRDLLVVVLAGATYHVTNVGLVGTAIALTDGRRVLEGVLEDGLYHLATTGAVLGLSPLVMVVLAEHWGFLPILVLPLGLVWTTANMALERERRALRDELTGLATRERLARRVSGLVAELSRDAGRQAAVCLVDLDRFKEVNDTFGHATGDELLREVAARLRGAVRPDDLVARLGGDEFALLVELPAGQPVDTVLDRVVAELHVPYNLDGLELEIEASVGVAVLPGDGRDLEVLLRRADAAMYTAKAAGEDLVRFTSGLDRSSPGRLPLLADLRRGLSGDELCLHYQPQVDVHGTLVGVEALVRWRHPSLGLLGPETFLPLAERTSTMRRITATVLELALVQHARWRAEGIEVPVSVNVSLHDLADERFVPQIRAGLERHGADPGCLRLEVTEHALVSDPQRVASSLWTLRDAGIELSIDDFGTGHASLTRLKNLPVSEVKVDRRFVTDLGPGRTRDVAIVRAILDLARTLGLRTVAEGVETEPQRQILAELGCDAMQGWLVARPLPAHALEAWLRGAPAERRSA